MINRLINMEIEPVECSSITITPMEKGKFTVAEYATAFINGMSDSQKTRFKKMMDNGIRCGMSVADNYGVDYNEFINEVKKQMEG